MNVTAKLSTIKSKGKAVTSISKMCINLFREAHE